MFKIKLKDFEGPFDLLLYFIKRDELDIYNIPISQIAEEFLEYLKMMQFLDIEVASEFIVMAATLLQIKAEMMLKQGNEDEQDDAPENDPRTSLVEQLIEYKKFKEASSFLSQKLDDNKFHYYRELYDADISEFEKQIDFKNATLFNLMNALQKIIKRNEIQKIDFHQVNLFPFTVEEKKEEIRTLLKRKSRINFMRLIENFSKIEIIITFLSVLELSRANEITLFQESEFSDIIINVNLNLN